MQNNVKKQPFLFDCIQWTGSNKEEILKFSLIMNIQKCFFSSDKSLWIKIDRSEWRLEIGDFILKSEAGLTFYRQDYDI